MSIELKKKKKTVLACNELFEICNIHAHMSSHANMQSFQ